MSFIRIIPYLSIIIVFNASHSKRGWVGVSLIRYLGNKSNSTEENIGLMNVATSGTTFNNDLYYLCRHELTFNKNKSLANTMENLGPCDLSILCNWSQCFSVQLNQYPVFFVSPKFFLIQNMWQCYYDNWFAIVLFGIKQ